MVVQVTPQVEAMIRRKIDTGLYVNADAVLRAALRLLDEQESRLQRLRSAIIAGERGESVPLTPDLVERMKRDAVRMAQEGKQPNPDVCPE